MKTKYNTKHSSFQETAFADNDTDAECTPRFSIKNKLLIVFGLLIFVVGFTLGVLGIQVARRAVTEKVETHLKDKAADTAEIIDSKISLFFQFLEDVADIPIIKMKQPL